jgi:hypothetical protein
MPNHSSLVRRIADLRSSYTGETDSSVLPATARGLQLLTTGERMLLLGALGGDYTMRLLGENAVPPLSADIRRAVLPDAATTIQQELEAHILLAAGRAVPHLHARRNRDPEPTARVFRMVRPVSEELVVHVEPPALAPLLVELLPRQVGRDVLGVAGLRMHLHRRHLQLCLADAPDARVLIANVSYRQWAAALAFVEVVAGAGFAALWRSADGRQPLTPVEAEALAARGRGATVVAAPLVSSLLRRILLFGEAPWVTVNSTSGAAAAVAWHAGPSLPRAATKLVHPIVGLPGDLFQVLRLSRQQVTISDHDQTPRSTRPGGDATTLVLRQVAEPGADLHQNRHRDGEVDTVRAWDKWSEVLSAPNPTWYRPEATETA